MRYFSAVLFNCCDCLNCIYFIVHLCCLSRIVSSLSARITFSVSLIFLVVSCIVLNIEHTFSKYYKVLKNYCSFVDKYSTSWNTHIYECMHSYMLTKSFCLWFLHFLALLFLQLQLPVTSPLLHSCNTFCLHLWWNLSFFIIIISIPKTLGSLRVETLIFFYSWLLTHYLTYHLIRVWNIQWAKI